MEVSIANPTEIDSLASENGKEIQFQVSDPKPIVEHIVPEKWFCLVVKCSSYTDYGDRSVEAFINFEWSERVDDPKVGLVCAHGGDDHHHHHHEETKHPHTGSEHPGKHHYHIPYVLDRAYTSREMKIFDFVVGRKAMRWARKQTDFLNVLIQTAIESIEENYSEVIDRNSLAVSSKTDYKLSPNSSSSTNSQNAPNDLLPGLTPYMERKLADLTKSKVIPQAKTGLTSAQRKLLLESLNLSHMASYSFMKLELVSSFQSMLKMNIFACTIFQNERNITLQLNLPQGASTLQWNISEDLDSAPSHSSSSIISGSKGVPQPLSADSSPTSFFEAFVLVDGSEHALCLAFYSSIDSSQSYATISGQKVVFVLRKSATIFWPSILATPSS